VNASGDSGLMFPSTITCFHFSYSERVKRGLLGGVVPRGAIPILAKVDFSSGCLRLDSQPGCLAIFAIP
jgi:hypothetical protein